MTAVGFAGLGERTMTAVRDILRTMDYGLAPESDEHARAWLAAHSDGFGHFIAGAFTPPGRLFDVFNPARGERIARVSQGTASRRRGGGRGGAQGR